MTTRIDAPGRTAGFSLVELLVVIGIILVLAAIALPVIGVVRNSVRKSQTSTLVQSLTAACEVYAIEDRRRQPPPAEADLSLRTAPDGDPPRSLDLLRDRGMVWRVNMLGPGEATGRPLCDAWQRNVRYQPDVDMDGTMDGPAPLQTDWNAKQREPFAYIWSLGKPSGAGDVADATVTHVADWIYTRSAP